ncbi:thermonuclease family protein [Ectothiorhodospiraceae bacterium BW-2]|nr:thermonuclease family protein [Ectothiorhodospiraceae bacterium BW-2]
MRLLLTKLFSRRLIEAVLIRYLRLPSMNNFGEGIDCIDTPEIGQKPWGEQSRDHLRAIIGSEITLKRHTTDRYGRVVAELFDATGQSVNLAMVRAGRAAVYGRYCSDAAYFAAEREARTAKLGIWAVDGGQQRPWEWRAGR